MSGWKPKHKFNAKRCELDGFKFDSKKEATYYMGLKLRVRSGDVVFFLRQVPFHLPGGVTYRVDFQEFHKDGSIHFIDVKGMRTKEYIAKKKLVEALYPIIIEEI
jgi:hypothetical protein